MKKSQLKKLIKSIVVEAIKSNKMESMSKPQDPRFKEGRREPMAAVNLEEDEMTEEEIDEQTSCNAAGGQAGGTISVPAWGSKNYMNSRATRAAKKYGTVVNDISKRV